MINLENLKEIRMDKNITQEKMADILKVKRSALAKWEIGASYPNLEIIYNYSKFFNLKIDYVLGLIEIRTNAKYNNYDKDLFINNIKNLRIDKNYSQQRLAKKFGLTQAAINRYEKGLSNPSLNIIYKYSNFFKISFHDLCTRKL